jgi:hypothetical protein
MKNKYHKENTAQIEGFENRVPRRIFDTKKA